MDKGVKVTKISDYLKKKSNKKKEELRKKLAEKLKEARRVYDGE